LHGWFSESLFSIRVVIGWARRAADGGQRHSREGPLNLPQYAAVLALSEALWPRLQTARRCRAALGGPVFKTVKVDIRCPFADDHPNRGDEGCALLSGGGVCCHHATCDGRRTDDFVARLKELATEAGLDGKAIYAGAYGKIVIEGFIQADHAELARLARALSAGDVAAIEAAAVSAADLPFPPCRGRVLDVLAAADALDLAGALRARAVIAARDAEDAVRVAACSQDAPMTGAESRAARTRLARETLKKLGVEALL
jgi:hypothetical protein